MKAVINAKLGDGQFSTPSEYVRSLIRSDQQHDGHYEFQTFLKHGLRLKTNLLSQFSTC